jgi:uncharacterized membrane protein
MGGEVSDDQNKSKIMFYTKILLGITIGLMSSILIRILPESNVFISIFLDLLLMYAICVFILSIRKVGNVRKISIKNSLRPALGSLEVYLFSYFSMVSIVFFLMG